MYNDLSMQRESRLRVGTCYFTAKKQQLFWPHHAVAISGRKNNYISLY